MSIVPEDFANNEAAKINLAEKEKRLLEQVVQQGQSLLYTWTHIDSVSGHLGVQFINPVDRQNYPLNQDLPKFWEDDGLTLLQIPPQGDSTKLADSLKKNSVYEVLVIAPVVRDIMGTKKVSKQVYIQGLLGRKKLVQREVDEPCVVDREQLSLNQALGVDSKEPAVGIYYLANDQNDPTLPRQSQYKDRFGRPGNSLNFKLIVSSQLAQEIATLIPQDPGLIRKLVDTVVYHKYPRSFRQEVWAKYGFPPYSDWENHKHPQLYFEDLNAKPENIKNLGNIPFNPQKIIKFHTDFFQNTPFGIVDTN